MEGIKAMKDGKKSIQLIFSRFFHFLKRLPDFSTLPLFSVG